MNNKFIKKLIVIMMICKIILPTYSAVSVSDSSAFITKAEFTTEVKDLTNRVINLEESLDTKIDSLVASYLSRNGIWNGEKQQLENTTVISRTASSLTQLIYSSKEATLGSGTLVSKTTKSGLASLVLTSKTGGQCINYSGRINRDAVQHDTNGAIFAFFNTSDGIVATLYLGLITTGNLGSSSDISQNWADSIASWFPMSSTTSFFIKKNSSLSISVKSFMNAPNKTSIYYSNSTYTNGNLTLTVDSVYIY